MNSSSISSFCTFTTSATTANPANSSSTTTGTIVNAVFSNSRLIKVIEPLEPIEIPVIRRQRTTTVLGSGRVASKSCRERVFYLKANKELDEFEKKKEFNPKRRTGAVDLRDTLSLPSLTRNKPMREAAAAARTVSILDQIILKERNRKREQELQSQQQQQQTLNSTVTSKNIKSNNEKQEGSLLTTTSNNNNLNNNNNSSCVGNTSHLGAFKSNKSKMHSDNDLLFNYRTNVIGGGGNQRQQQQEQQISSFSEKRRQFSNSNNNNNTNSRETFLNRSSSNLRSPSSPTTSYYDRKLICLRFLNSFERRVKNQNSSSMKVLFELAQKDSKIAKLLKNVNKTIENNEALIEQEMTTLIENNYNSRTSKKQLKKTGSQTDVNSEVDSRVNKIERANINNGEAAAGDMDEIYANVVKEEKENLLNYLKESNWNGSSRGSLTNANKAKRFTITKTGKKNNNNKNGGNSGKVINKGNDEFSSSSSASSISQNLKQQQQQQKSRARAGSLTSANQQRIKRERMNLLRERTMPDFCLLEETGSSSRRQSIGSSRGGGGEIDPALRLKPRTAYARPAFVKKYNQYTLKASYSRTPSMIAESNKQLKSGENSKSMDEYDISSIPDRSNLNRPSYSAHMRKMAVEKEKSILLDSNRKSEDDVRSASSVSTKEMKNMFNLEKNTSQRKLKLPDLIPHLSEQDAGLSKTSLDLKSSAAAKKQPTESVLASSLNENHLSTILTTGSAVNSLSNSADNYLLNQAIIYKRIAEYNQKKGVKFVKIASSKNLIDSNKSANNSTMSENSQSDSTRTITNATPPVLERRKSNLSPATLKHSPEPNNSSSDTSSTEVKTETLTKENVLTRQATLANEFNHKIKLTNKKLDDLNRKLRLYKASQSRFCKPVMALSANESNNKKISATISEPVLNSARMSINEKKIVEKDETNQSVKEDLSSPVKETVKLISESPIIPSDSISSNDINESSYQPGEFNKLALSELALVSEPTLPKSQGIYNYVATSTSQLITQSNQKRHTVNEDELLDESLFHQESQPSQESQVEPPTTTTSDTAEYLEFFQFEQEVLRLQKQVLDKMQRSLDSATSDIPASSSNLLQLISQSYNTNKSKMDVYKFYERSSRTGYNNLALSSNGNKQRPVNTAPLSGSTI